MLHEFNKIYQIAIEAHDFEDLKRKLKKYHINALGKKDGVWVNVGAQLAFEGQDDRVEWLRLLGADVSTIAAGYARASRHDKVESYRTEYQAKFNGIALAYARIGNHVKVVEYSLSTQHQDYTENLSIIAHGYAIAKNHDKVEEYRHLGADINLIALGYAIAGDHNKVEEYRHLGAKINSIALGYAMTGNHSKVKEYRTKYSASVDEIAKGYAIAGNHERVETYRTSYSADPLVIAQGYQEIRNHEKRKKYDLTYLLDSYLEHRRAVMDSSGRTREYFYGSLFSIFQKSYTQEKAAIDALKNALNGDDSVDLSKHLSTLRNGTLGKELREFVKAGMANTIVGKEVTTVTGFVQALQEQNSPAP